MGRQIGEPDSQFLHRFNLTTPSTFFFFVPAHKIEILNVRAVLNSHPPFSGCWSVIVYLLDGKNFGVSGATVRRVKTAQMEEWGCSSL
jgi:hypothetical protein